VSTYTNDRPPFSISADPLVQVHQQRPTLNWLPWHSARCAAPPGAVVRPEHPAHENVVFPRNVANIAEIAIDGTSRTALEICPRNGHHVFHRVTMPKVASASRSSSRRE
jgi:hypothetical protein